MKKIKVGIAVELSNSVRNHNGYYVNSGKMGSIKEINENGTYEIYISSGCYKQNGLLTCNRNDFKIY